MEQDLQAAWHVVDTKWFDPAPHRRFVALCAARGELAEAARCYRLVRDADPVRRAEAERRLEAVQQAALLSLLAGRANPRSPTSARRARLFWLVCGVCAGLCGYGILTVLRLLRP